MTVVYTKTQIDSMGAKIGQEIKKTRDESIVVNQNTTLPINFWVGTQAEYDAITTKDANTLYVVEE